MADVVSIDFERLRQAVKRDRIVWQRHALERMAKRAILRTEVREAILGGELIEDYPEDYPYPSCLILGGTKRRPLHVVAALDQDLSTAYVITVYEPGLDHFEPDLRTRRKK